MHGTTVLAYLLAVAIAPSNVDGQAIRRADLFILRELGQNSARPGVRVLRATPLPVRRSSRGRRHRRSRRCKRNITSALSH